MASRAVRTIVILAAVAAASLPAQDSKPAKAPKTDSAPAVKPTEMTVLGRKVTLAVPPEWNEVAQPGTFALDAWKHAKGWQHSRAFGFAIHVYGVEEKGLTPASLVKSWLDAAGNAKPESIVSVPGRNKSLRGLDTEVELSENGALSFYWMRAVAFPPDKVLVVLVEMSPFRADALEGVVDAALPILDSLLDPLKTDPWKRDPQFTLTRGGLITRLTAPAGWTYNRDAQGWFGWIGPVDGQTVQLAFPATSVSAVNEKGEPVIIPPAELFNMLSSAYEEGAKKGGKLLSKTPVPGHGQGTEIVSVENPGPEETVAEWSRSRLFLDGSHVVLVTATCTIPNVDSLPPEAYQKLVGACVESVKMELVKPK